MSIAPQGAIVATVSQFCVGSLQYTSGVRVNRRYGRQAAGRARDTLAPRGMGEDDTNLAVSIRVLTTDTSEQTIPRSGSRADNKGMEAGLVAIEMDQFMKAD